MSATVTAYSGDPMDTRISLMCECLTCGIEWGWQYDGPGVYDRLKTMADDHNRTTHEKTSPAEPTRDFPSAGAPKPTEGTAK